MDRQDISPTTAMEVPLTSMERSLQESGIAANSLFLQDGKRLFDSDQFER